MKLQRVLAGGCLCVFLGLAALSCADGKSIDRPAPRQIGGNMVMCHIPPADPKAAETIEVSSAEVAAHMERGDRVGPCTEKDMACTPLGESCGEDADCCTENCLDSRCSGHCRAVGVACENDGNCCSEECRGGHCRP